MTKNCLSLLLAALCAVSMWVWVQKIVVPEQQADAAAFGKPRGNLSDLYPRWLGAHELLLHHRDPYRTDVTREIQIGYYGRPLDPTRPNDPKDQQAFAYPIYVVLLLAPIITLPFPTVHWIAFWLFGAMVALSVPMWLRTLGWRVSRTGLAVWILLALGSFPAAQALKLQQLTVLVAALIASSMMALVQRHFVVAGILLAFATIKPQVVFLLVLWLCLWVLGNWPERQRFLWSFAITMIILVAAGEALLPGWITEFRAAVRAYYQYTGGGKSVLDMALPATVGRIMSAVLVCVFFFLTWRRRHAAESTADFQWIISFALATTLLVIPTFAPYNQILLLPGVMLIARSIRMIWHRGRLWRFFLGLVGIVLIEQWIASLLLAAMLLFLPGVTVQKGWMVPFYSSPVIPIVIYAQLLLLGSGVSETGQRQRTPLASLG